MTVAEPVTVISDYLLALLSAVFAYRLYARSRVSRQGSVLLWSVAFVALALASLSGGSYHALDQQSGLFVLVLLWKITLYAMGLVSASVLAATAVAMTLMPWRKWLLLVAGVKLAVYWLWMLQHNAYHYVIVDYVAAMVVVLLLHLLPAARRQAQAVRWLGVGILVSFAAAAAQQGGVSLHRYFNHNDLYHVLQLLALYLLYRGAMLYQDCK